MLEEYILTNGMKVATYRLPQVRSIHARISVKSGSIMENKKNNGISHFLEHMLVQGIPSFPTSEDLSMYVENLAGSYGAYTESTMISFQITTPSTHIEDAIKICSEVFFAPLFSDSAFGKEKHVILNEISQKMDSHYYKISKYLNDSRFGSGHPLTYMPVGSNQNIKKLKKDDLKNYWSRYFVPDNAYLLIIGNFDSKDVKIMLERYFGLYTKCGNLPGFPKMNNKDISSKWVHVRRDNQLGTVYLDLTFPSITLGEKLKDRLIQKLCLVVLGQLRHSRLFKLLRYQKGLVYNISAGSNTMPGTGYVSIYSEVSPENLDEVLELIVKELSVFTKNGPTGPELESAKNYLTNQWLMAFDHPSSIASWIEDDLLWENQVFLPETYAEFIKDITVSDMLDIMDRYWDYSRVNLTLQGPVSKSRLKEDHYKAILTSLLESK